RMRLASLRGEVQEGCNSIGEALRDWTRSGPPVLQLLIEPIAGLESVLKQCSRDLESSPSSTDVDRVCNAVRAIVLPPKPGKDASKVKAASCDERELFIRGQSRFDDLKKMVNDLQSGIARYSATECAAGIARIGPQVLALVELVAEFRRRYAEAKRERGSVD